jgi:putative transcriptional regulator
MRMNFGDDRHDHQGRPRLEALTKADLQRMKKIPRVKIIREGLRLAQEEFSARYHIPSGTLRDWEQQRKAPDQSARAY